MLRDGMDDGTGGHEEYVMHGGDAHTLSKTYKVRSEAQKRRFTQAGKVDPAKDRAKRVPKMPKININAT